METHKGLEKAAEERVQGLAKSDPIQVTDKSRTNTGGAFRQDTFAKFLDYLHYDDLVRAANEVGLAWKIRDNPAMLKTTQRLFGRVGGLGLQDATDYMVDLEARFGKWLTETKSSELSPKRNMAIRICGEGYTYEQISWDYNLDYRSVKKYARDALEVYVLANKRDKKPLDAQVIIKVNEFCPTRVVTYEDIQ